MDEDALLSFLCSRSTTVELVKSIYPDLPRLSDHTVDHLFACGNPARFEILQFLSSVNWFRMEGIRLYERLFRSLPTKG